MGVHGLWKLIEPSGRVIPLESMTDKVLAVDVSIWLHQAMKGMHDTHGAPIAVAHLLILFHRLCKLLFYKIKPVFVFDGGVPMLKRQTMAMRRQQSNAARSEAAKVRGKLLKNILKHEAVRQVLANEAATAALGLSSFTLPGPAVEEDLYKLPPIAAESVNSNSSEEEESSAEEEEDKKHFRDIHSIDVRSEEFLSLPPEIRHEILTELIETRKQNSWKHLDRMPRESGDFSDFQMNRLLKRHAVQVSLEQAGKEMGGKALSLQELEELLGEQGVIKDDEGALPSKRIAQDSVTRYMLVKRSDTDEKPSGEEKKIKIKEEKEFDITEHLQDVDWSSESDLEEIVPELVVPKSDVAEILAVLEDEKVENLEVVELEKESVQQSKDVELEKPLQIEEIAIKEAEGDNTENLATEDVEPEKEAPALEERSPEISLQLQKEALVLDPTPERVASPVKEETPLSSIATEAVQPPSEAEKSVLLPEKEITVGETVSPTEKENSSSDSEGDFVPIDDSTDRINLLEEGERLKRLELVIDPSNIDKSNDIFADVFTSEDQNKEIPCSPPRPKSASEEIAKLDKEIAALDKILEEEDEEGMSAEEEEKEKEKHEFKERMTEEELIDLQRNLEEQQDDLLAEQGKQERHAQSVTEQMCLDAQELLRLFGVPYVVAPMEAEAQCAVLDMLGLTKGTITDDSDIWLFGGRVVYKNFFNQKKHVLEYRSEDIQKYFKLSREEMIKLAMLVGSDYTPGLTGVGPVTALEILAAFPNSSQGGLLTGLQKFRDWVAAGYPTGPSRNALKKKMKNTEIIPGFPSNAVVEAYLHPAVDDSDEPFSWAKPNVKMIQNYTKIKFGWSDEKCNELLMPVMKKLMESSNQTTMEKYFRVAPKPSLSEGLLSKRVENAVKRLGKEHDSEESDPDDPKPVKKRKVTKPRAPKTAKPAAEKPSTSFEVAKAKSIKQKLHAKEKIPQKEFTQKILEDRKRKAVEMFKTSGNKKGKKKIKTVVKEQVDLSESSSDD